MFRKVETPEPSAKKITKFCDKILESFKTEKYVENFKICQEIIDSTDLPTDDQIKRARYTNELKEAATQYFLERGN
ncbi:hypothetical protein PPD64_001669 [Providencia stuartii]|uniref:hypothetical protein n=1 Tax=Providencia TaxID=586 RepID=UPI00234A0CAB|nr:MULTISPECIES: hypothetical protein [Providencia]MCR4081290.1 hypothetical protein [Providencia stuartii]